MTRTKISTLLICFGCYFVPSLAFIFLLVKYGGFPPVATWVLPVIMYIFSVILLYLGWKVKKYKTDKKVKMNQLKAAKIAVLAKTASIGGSSIAGFCGAQSVIFFVYDQAPYLSDMILLALQGFFACILTSIVGVIVENWCIVDDDDKKNKMSENLSPSC